MTWALTFSAHAPAEKPKRPSLLVSICTHAPSALHKRVKNTQLYPNQDLWRPPFINSWVVNHHVHPCSKGFNQLARDSADSLQIECTSGLLAELTLSQNSRKTCVCHLPVLCNVCQLDWKGNKLFASTQPHAASSSMNHHLAGAVSA